MDFSELRYCTELRDVHIGHAVASASAMEALLARFTVLAAPGKGAPIVLAALARLGTTACDWIDGELRIEITGDTAQSKISVSTSLGACFREKLFADTVLRVPLQEFSLGIKRAPKLIEPLEVKESGARIVLSASQEVRRTSLPPPMVTIDPTSLMLVPLVPQVPTLLMPHGLETTKGAPSPPATTPKVVLRRRVKDDPQPK